MERSTAGSTSASVNVLLTLGSEWDSTHNFAVTVDQVLGVKWLHVDAPEVLAAQCRARRPSSRSGYCLEGIVKFCGLGRY